ncbi:MAG: alpha/beta hydrolase [Acidobacteria bacterium]|nr:alpha/beta hydrolase [Acidobacteriota bacterium]
MKTARVALGCGLLVVGSVWAEDDGPVREERTYKSVGGTDLRVDVFYSPEARQRPRNPAMAFFHGGGWAYGDRSEFHEACVRYAKKGFVTLSFQYRLSINSDETVPHPDITLVECTKDARSALRWIRQNAAALRVDPARVVASGQSAGGQLALGTALFDDVNESTDDLSVSPRPDALVLYSSNVNTLEAWADRLMGDRRGEIWSISPHHNLRAGLPPTIEFHGEEDCMVPFWVVRHFVEKARSLGNEIELVSFEGRRHYLGDGDPAYGRYYDEGVLERTDRFLEEHGFIAGP